MADKEAADHIEENFVKMGQKVVEYARRKDIKGSQPFISLLEPVKEHNDEDEPTSGKCQTSHGTLNAFKFIKKLQCMVLLQRSDN